jgi:NAD-dependent DNA ligase
MNKLEQYLNVASRAYYAGTPIISDAQFDQLAESIGYSAVGAKTTWQCRTARLPNV